jgi:hypothetical protein
MFIVVPKLIHTPIRDNRTNKTVLFFLEVKVIQISIILNQKEFNALRTLANNDLRDPRAQALLIIRNELINKKLIQPEINLIIKK